MYVTRELESQLKNLLDDEETISIVGPRQSGKTTLLKRLEKILNQQNKSVEFITFEKNKQRKLFEEIEEFKNTYQQKDVVLIDEFQYAEGAGQKLKYLYDTTDTKFIITGSSSLDLNHKTGKYMVGRMFTFNLYPFSFREFVKTKDKRTFEMLEERFPDPFDSFDPDQAFGKAINDQLEDFFEEYMIYGGYPKVVLSDDRERKELILENNLENYLTKEIKELLSLASDDNLLKLAEALAAQIGNLVNYNNLSGIAELSHQKTKEHLNIFEKTFICEFIKPFYTNKQKEIVKNPVPYFIDPGFRNYLVDDFRKFRLRNDVGALVENFVFMALKRRQKSELRKVKYWRTKSKAEVDFVIRKRRKPKPIEVKYSSDPTPGKSFYSFLRKYEPKEGYVLTKGKSKVIEAEGTKINFVPVWYL